MDSRQQILDAIRRHDLEERELPNLDQAWITFDDPQQQFSQVLETVGGQCLVVASPEDINSQLAQYAAYSESSKICSLIDGVGNSNVYLESIDDPHQCEDIDFAIFPGEFAVAENGAVWVTEMGLKHRVAYFIAQHVALVVPQSEIVNNMHEAYQRLSFTESQFGTFISGPSKTADIEQSLVIGAHGARSMTVFLLK